MKINQAGIDLIKMFEGCKLIAYKCTSGYWTIGYGHTKDVKQGDRISQHQADIMLGYDIEKFEIELNALLKGMTVTQNQFNALMSFIFNFGAGRLKTSTLLRKFKAGDVAGAANEFKRWNISAGKVSEGLVRRREAEKIMFLKV